MIVVNDASTDDTAAVLDALAAGDSRLKVVHLAENVGVHAARTQGVRARDGHVPRVRRFRRLDRAPDVRNPVRGSGPVRRRCRGLRRGHRPCRPINSPAPRFASAAGGLWPTEILDRFCRFEFGSGVLWNKLYSTALVRPFAELPLPRNVDAAEDYVVNVGCFARARRVVTLPVSLYYYFERPESASRAGANAKGFWPDFAGLQPRASPPTQPC